LPVTPRLSFVRKAGVKAAGESEEIQFKADNGRTYSTRAFESADEANAFMADNDGYDEGRKTVNADEYVPRDGWRENLFKAREFANVLGVDHAGLKLRELVRAIDREITKRNLGPRKKDLTYRIAKTDDGFIIEGANHKGLVLDGKPMGAGILSDAKARIFGTEEEARSYMRKKGMKEETKPIKRILLGRIVSFELGQSSLRPSRDELKKVAQKLGISAAEARRALDAYNEPSGVSEAGNKTVMVPAQIVDEALGRSSNEPKGRRARAGGERGINGEWYDGGQFMPASAYTIKGAHKADGGDKAAGRRVLVEPGKVAPIPDGKRAIFSRLSEFVDVDAGGRLTLDENKPDAAFDHYFDGGRAEARDLVRRYNEGQRWIDADYRFDGGAAEKQAAADPIMEKVKDLLWEQKNVNPLDKRAIGALKRKIRAFAKKVPSDHNKAVMGIDMLATRLDMDDIEFAPPAKSEAPAKGEEQTKGKAWGADNKLVTQDRAEEIRRKLCAKLGQVNSGVDPELFALGAELAVFHIEAGARSFTAFAKAMIADLVDAARRDRRCYTRRRR